MENGFSAINNAASTGRKVDPLKVIIAGAGIGGLSAAVALRKAGHVVEIYESSRFATELGAAIHLPPNVNAVLHRFGLDPSSFGANDTEWVSVFSSQGEIISRRSMAKLKEEYPHPWKLSHRVDLHEALKWAAVSPNGGGTPVTLNLQSKVVACDPSAPSLTLDNGVMVNGDLLIAADGVHSTLRRAIAHEDIPAFPSGASAFRFLVPIEKVKGNSVTRALVEKPGDMQLWEGSHRRLVIYPCRYGTDGPLYPGHNTELNFVCLHPDHDSQNSIEGWNNTASVNDVSRVFQEFYEPMRTLLGMADSETVKIWRLYDRGALKTWVNGYAALLGDAAHPFLPHQGQGGAQAIEDGAALGALFPLGTRKEEVPERLNLYMQARYDRATMVQNFSRQMAFRTSDADDVGGFSMDPLEFSKINFRHDAYLHAEAILANHKDVVG